MIISYKMHTISEANMKTSRLPWTSIILLLFLFAPAWSDFTIAVYTDTQSIQDGQSMQRMSEWVVSQKDALNIVHVAHMGDMTFDHGCDSYMWDNNKEAYDILAAADIPRSPCQGNHDYIECLRDRFPVSDFENEPWFGGYSGGMENAYYLHTWEGMDFIILVVQFRDSKDWANEILEKYSDRRAIFITHDFYDDPSMQYDIVENHDNVFTSWMGHIGSFARWTATTPSNNTVHMIMQDYQWEAGGGPVVRYYTFKTEENRVDAFSYHVINEEYWTSDAHQFSFEYAMEPVEPDPWITISNTSEIVEGTEDSGIIDVTLGDDSFSDSLILSNWTVANLPEGVTLGSVSRSSDTSAVLTLSGSSKPGTYITDITTVSVTVSADALVLSDTALIVTSGVTLMKTEELAWISIFSESEIIEGDEDGGTITVSLKEDMFSGSLNPSNWTVNNLPEGVTLGSVTRSDNTSAALTLLGNSEPGTYSGDITKVSVTVSADEFVSTDTELTATTGVTLTKIKEKPRDPWITISNASKIVEGAEDGATIDVTVIDDEFSQSLDLSNWTATNLPEGVTLGAVTRSDNTNAVLTLSGNSEPGTYSENSTHVSVRVSNDEFVNSLTELTATSGVTLTKNPLAPSTSPIRDATLSLTMTYQQIIFNNYKSIDTISIISLNGRVVIDNVKISGRTFNTGRLTSGVYHVNIRGTDGKRFNTRIVKL